MINDDCARMKSFRRYTEERVPEGLHNSNDGIVNGAEEIQREFKIRIALSLGIARIIPVLL